MSNTATLNKIKAILSTTDVSDEVLEVYLDMATNEILIWTFGRDTELNEILIWTFGRDTELTDIPTWLEPIAIMAVVVGVNGNGTEGDKADTIDSVSHDFKYAEMLEYIHENAPSYVKVDR